MALSTRFTYEDRRWRAHIHLLAAQPKPKPLPTKLKEANLDELLDNYLTRGVGDHNLAERLVFSSMRLLPLKPRPPSARRGGPAVHATLPPLPRAEEALVVEPPKSDTSATVPVMAYGSFVGQPPLRAAFIGPTNCGKTTLMETLIRKHYGPYMVATGGGVWWISRTLDADEIVKSPELAPFIKKKLDNFNTSELYDLRDRQKALVKRLGKGRAPQWLICLNDFAWDDEVMHSPLMREMFMTWRHYGISIFIDTQKLTSLWPALRNNTQIFFMFECVGSEEKLYEDNLRSRNVKASAFRDLVEYALAPHDDEQRIAVEAARKRGEMYPEFARAKTFVVYNKQCAGRFAYRRGLAMVMELEPDGWLAPPHNVAHASNPAYARRNKILASGDTGVEVVETKKK